jgi:hypothetical protein
MLNEDHLNDVIESKAEKYFKNYKEQMEALQSKSALSKVRPITTHDFYQLGRMLEACDELYTMCEQDGSTGDLGIIPKIAYDVVTLSYGTSPINIVASTQTIDEEQGVVYYKDVVAQDTLGNMTAGQTIYSATSAPKFPVGYSGQNISETLGNVTVGSSTGPYAFTLTYTPVRPQTVSLTFTDDGDVFTFTDDGEGGIVGAGGYGTITYSGASAGVISLTLAAAPTDTDAVTATYQCQIEAKDDVPIAQYELQSKPILARVYALKSTFGMLKSFQLRKRFGVVAEEEAAIDLTNAINMEIFGDCLTKIKAQYGGGSTTWSSTAPTGVSYYEHQFTFKNTLAVAEGKLVTAAGRGTISFIIGGSTVCAVIQALPGFQRIYDGNSISGAHLFGTLDGIPVVRVPIAAMLGAGDAYIGYKGPSAWEAGAVYAPYMPLTVTSVLPTPNPILQQRAAAVWAAVEVMVPKFLGKITVT